MIRANETPRCPRRERRATLQFSRLLAERWATTRASGIAFEQSLRAQWSVFERRQGPLPEVLTREKCYRAMIVRCATVNSPSRADPILCRAIGPIGVPRRGTPKWKSRLSEKQHERNRARMSRVRRSTTDDCRWAWLTASCPLWERGVAWVSQVVNPLPASHAGLAECNKGRQS